jgi:hypothetical protein
MHAIALRINASIAGVVIPGLVAGVIYFAIAFATGASAAASIIGGIVVAGPGRSTNRAKQDVDGRHRLKTAGTGAPWESFHRDGFGCETALPMVIPSFVVGRPGLEPGTLGLKVPCST